MGLREKRGSNSSLGSAAMHDVVIWAEVIDQGERSRSESELGFREREPVERTGAARLGSTAVKELVVVR